MKVYSAVKGCSAAAITRPRAFMDIGSSLAAELDWLFIGMHLNLKRAPQGKSEENIKPKYRTIRVATYSSKPKHRDHCAGEFPTLLFPAKREPPRNYYCQILLGLGETSTSRLTYASSAFRTETTRLWPRRLAYSGKKTWATHELACFAQTSTVALTPLVFC